MKTLAILIIIVGTLNILHGIIGIRKKKITVGHVKHITVTGQTATIWGIIYILFGIMLSVVGIYMLN